MYWNILSYIVIAIAISWVPVFAYIILRMLLVYLRGEKDADVLETKKEKIIVYTTCILLSLAYLTMKDYWGTDTIGSFFSRNEFNAQYYVHLFPSGSTSKNYLLPADLHVYENGIAVEKVYWLNGGYITFGNYDSYDMEELRDNKQVKLRDDAGRLWLIVLTGNKVEK